MVKPMVVKARARAVDLKARRRKEGLRGVVASVVEVYAMVRMGAISRIDRERTVSGLGETHQWQSR